MQSDRSMLSAAVRTPSIWLPAAALTLSLAATSAQAGLTDVNIFNNTSYSQTSAAAPTTPTGYFFDIGGSMQNAGDFDGATTTYPGAGSPANLPINGLFFGIGTPLYPTLTALHVDYPFGTYSITATNSGTSATQTGAFNYTAEHFTSDIPTLTPSTFTGLQGLDPTAGFTISFNSFTPDPLTTGITFFSIHDPSNTIVFNGGFMSPSTTSVFVPANTLLANTNYSWELDFSDRLTGFDKVNGTNTQQGFDVRTDGAFTTGAPALVPEPATLALLGASLVGSAVIRRHRTR